LRLATDRDGIQACFLSHRPKIGRHKTSSSSKPTLSWVRPSWVCGAHCAFGAVGIACSAASLQGFHPSVGWGTPPPDFSTYGVPGSPGVHPPKGIPLARTLASRQRRRISRPGAAAPSVASASSRGDTRSASFGLAGKHPMRAPTLCSKFQRSGKLACLFSRLPALRGLCPPPRTRGFGRAGKRTPVHQAEAARATTIPDFEAHVAPPAGRLARRPPDRLSEPSAVFRAVSGLPRRHPPLLLPGCGGPAPCGLAAHDVSLLT
jgi:hypothetical protein